MAPKRRRVDEDVEDVDDVQAEETCSKPKPHDELWFGDGSIVLVTDVHLYRVHKGMLAKYSTVLGDMFEMPSGGANTECWEGVPIVKMVGDSDEEVCVLLKALYNRNFRDTFEGTSMSILASLLSISTKYDFGDVRKDVIQYLESIFPSTYEKYKESKLHTLAIPEAELYTLLGVAHRCEALSILPILYVQCANLPTSKLFELSSVLPRECTNKLIKGRDWLTFITHLLNVYAFPTKSCCVHTFRSQLEEFVSEDFHFELVINLPERGILEGSDNDVCKSCARRYVDLLNTLKNEAWKCLPEQFMDKKWAEITG